MIDFTATSCNKIKIAVSLHYSKQQHKHTIFKQKEELQQQQSTVEVKGLPVYPFPQNKK